MKKVSGFPDNAVEKKPALSSLERSHGLVGWEGCRYKTLVAGDGSFAPLPYPYVVAFWVYDADNGKILEPEKNSAQWRLSDGRLPVYEVKWSREGKEFVITVFAQETHSKGELATFARVSVKNRERRKSHLYLYAAIYRSNLHLQKDTDAVREMSCSGENFIEVNGSASLYFFEKPDNIGFVKMEEGHIRDLALSGLLPSRKNVVDEKGRASGAAIYKIKLGPGDEKAFDFVLFQGQSWKGESPAARKINFDSSLKEVKSYWKNRVPVKLNLPDKRYTDCFYSSIYNMLMMMDADMLRPGPYAYGFALHDAVDMAGALDMAGLPDVAEKAVEYFNCRDNQNSYDGSGGAIYALYEHYRLVRDKKWLRKVYPRMIEGCRWLEGFRAKQIRPKLKKSPFYGLLPESTSQDNFNMKAHLYVDNWWGVIGFKAALQAAKILKKEKDIKWLSKEYENFSGCLLKSIAGVVRREKISYIPSFPDYCPPSQRIVDNDHRILGDTQMAWAHRPALFPGLSLGIEPPLELMKKSYRRYWKKAGKFSGYDGGWYVEYEKFFWGYNIMLAHPLMYVGMEDVALKNIEWSIKNQSCPGGWMEAMHTRLNEKGFREIDDTKEIVGDCPHGWVAAFYIQFIRNMLLREEGEKIILLSALPESWVKDGRSIEFRNVPTYFGPSGFLLESRLKKGYLKIKLFSEKSPPEGHILKSPLKRRIVKVKIDGKEWKDFEKDKINIPPHSKEIVVYYS